MNERRFQQLPTSGAPMAALDAPSIGGYSADSRLRPLAMNVRFENPAQGIAVQAVEMRELFLDVIFRRNAAGYNRS